MQSKEPSMNNSTEARENSAAEDKEINSSENITKLN